MTIEDALRMTNMLTYMSEMSPMSKYTHVTPVQEDAMMIINMFLSVADMFQRMINVIRYAIAILKQIRRMLSCVAEILERNNLMSTEYALRMTNISKYMIEMCAAPYTEEPITITSHTIMKADVMMAHRFLYIIDHFEAKIQTVIFKVEIWKEVIPMVSFIIDMCVRKDVSGLVLIFQEVLERADRIEEYYNQERRVRCARGRI